MAKKNNNASGTSTTINDSVSPNISMKDLILGYLSANVLYTLFSFLMFSVLFGPFLYPKKAMTFLVPYYTFTMLIKRVELKDGNHWHEFSKRNLLLRRIRTYLNLRIAKPVPKELTDLDNGNEQVILGVFPHGSYSDYRVVMDGMLGEVLPNIYHNKNKGVRTLAASALFRVPLAREIGLWTGCVDARRSVAEKLLKKGRSLVILPGGEAEQILTQRGKEIVYVEKRKGFIKLGMRFAIPVVPVYVFGASDYYYTSHAFLSARQWMVKNLGVAIPLTLGQWGSFMCPLPVPTTIVFGKPLTFQCTTPNQPTDEEVQAAHKEFVVALKQLFDDNKAQYGYGDRRLEIM